jgi:predicted nucleic acid-binding protein
MTTVVPIVLDAGVLASVATDGKLWEYWQSGSGIYNLILSPEIFTEVEKLLRNKSLGFEPYQIRAILLGILDRCELVRPKNEYKGDLPDAKDRHLVTLAIEAKADYIVSDDPALQARGNIGGITIVSPDAFFNPTLNTDDQNEGIGL